jgi:hypothetical protein
MYRCPLWLRFAHWYVLAQAFADHCRANGIDAAKATTDELREFELYREETS